MKTTRISPAMSQGGKYTWIAIAAAVAGFLGAVLFNADVRSALSQPAGSTAPAAPRLTDDQNAGLDNLIRLGALRLDSDAHEAWIDPEAWHHLDYEHKKGLAALAAARVQERTGSHWVDVRDKMSGKKLAKFSGAWGFSVE